jgi:MOSC domain-containing protein YiiM
MSREPLDQKRFTGLLERVITGGRISAEEVIELAEFVGGEQSTAAQRGAVVTAFGIWYRRVRP